MAINTNLLVAAPMLQDLLVDKSTGQPLANGTVTMYQDNSRTTFKNWYYQSGSPGSYTYITLPNPLTLSAAGTITDANGNDTIPFYYPFSETDNTTPQPYFVTVYNSNGQLMFTRQNFPFMPTSSGVGSIPTNKNLLVNNEFWRNVGTLTATNVTQATLAPSQHDGLTMPDIQFFKSTTGATETISFIPFVAPSSAPFTDQILPNDVTPEFYMQLNCTGAGAETFKYVQIPIVLHVDNLSGYTNASVAIQAMNVGGSVNNQITLSLLQYTGTGATSPSVTTVIKTLTLTDGWQKYIENFAFPTSQNLTLGGGGDDAWYLQIGFPAAKTCQINIAKPAVYLSTTVPTDDFDTYDAINSVISSPRTGDIRTSLNTFYPYGWVPMNDGSIGNASSNATSRANIDTWPLFNMLWQAFHSYTNGSTNLLAQMRNSSGSNVAYGGSAIADFNANNNIALTKMMGKVILGNVPVGALLFGFFEAYTTTFTASNSAGNLLITTDNHVDQAMFNGCPIIFTNSGGALPGNLSANTVYYVANFNGATTYNVSTSFANAMAGTVIAFSSTGTGTNTVDLAPAGAVEGEYAHTQLVPELALHHHSLPGSSLVTNAASGSGVNAWSAGSVNTGDTGSSTPFNVTQPGVFYNMFMKL